MQMHSSYVVTDPKGTILVECGKMLQRGAPNAGQGRQAGEGQERQGHLRARTDQGAEHHQLQKVDAL